MSSSLAEVASAGRKLLPIFEWIPAYRRKWLLPDVLAGVALLAVMVPEGMAYASIVGDQHTASLATLRVLCCDHQALSESQQVIRHRLVRLPPCFGFCRIAFPVLAIFSVL